MSRNKWAVMIHGNLENRLVSNGRKYGIAENEKNFCRGSE